jgi:hypothetical protein
MGKNDKKKEKDVAEVVAEVVNVPIVEPVEIKKSAMDVAEELRVVLTELPKGNREIDIAVNDIIEKIKAIKVLITFIDKALEKKK